MGAVAQKRCDMTRTMCFVRKFFFSFFLLCFFSAFHVKADIALSTGDYGLPYQWQMRRSSFYSPTQLQLFAGSIAASTGKALSVSSANGFDLVNYSPAGLSAGANTDAAGYETRAVWDSSLVYQGGATSSATPWLCSIMANSTGTAPDRQVYLVNLNDPTQVISFTAIQNATPVNTIPFKVCMAQRASSPDATAQQVLVMAIAGSASDTTFNTSSAGACFRLFRVNGSTLTEFANSKLDTSTLPNSIGELRDMWWDADLKRLYCAFARTDETKIGVCCMYLDETTPASPVLRLIQSPELLTSPSSGSALIPYVHKVRTFTTNHSSDSVSSLNKYLLINGGRDAAAYNRIYALPIYNASANPASTAQGAVERKANDGAAISSHDTSWLDQSNDINALTGGLNSTYSFISARTVGGGALPISPSTPVTDIQVVGLNVYVSVADTSGGECLFRSTAVVRHTSGTEDSSPIAGQNCKLVRWTAWKKVVDTDFNKPIVAFGVTEAAGNNKIIALRDDNSIVVRSATTFPSFVQVPQRSFSLVASALTSVASSPSTKLDIEDTSTMWRNRQLCVFDNSYRRVYAGTSLASQGSESLVVYVGGAAGAQMAKASLATSTLLTGIYNRPLWTMAMQGSLLLAVPHTEIDNANSFGGNKLYAIASGTFAGDNTTTDVKDMNNVASAIVNIAAAKKGNDTVIFAAIRDGTRNDFSSGRNNCIRMFKLQPDSLSIVPDSTFVYDLRTGGAPLAVQSGTQTGVLTYNSIEDMHFDSVFNGVYVALSKTTDGNLSDNDLGLTFVGWDTAGTAVRTSGKMLQGTEADLTGFKHVLKVRTLHTRIDTTTPANNRSYLIFNGTNYTGVSGGTGLVNAKLNRIYALPLVASGADAGKIATNTTHATRAELSSATWSETAGSAGHVVGGGYLPTNIRAVVTGMVVRGKSVFVSVANPQGIEGPCGVYVSHAVTDDDEKLVSWTAWKKLGGENENIAFLGYNAHTDTVVAVNHDSSRVEEFSWKDHAAVNSARSGIQNIYSFAKTLETDIAGHNRGIYTVQNLQTLMNDNTTQLTMIGAFNYDTVALGYVAKKAATDVGSVKYPHKLETSRYKVYANDTGLLSIKSLYSLAVPSRLPGWVIAGGYRGLAILRDDTTGKGFPALPSSLSDTVGASQPALTAQTWKAIPEIVGPVYKVVVMPTYDSVATDYAPIVICMTKKKLQAFVGNANKFKATPTQVLGMFDTSAIFTDPGEYMRDVAVVGGKMLLVGTTKGLYLMQISSNNDSFLSSPTSILYGGANLGPIGSIKITTPAFGTVVSGNPTGLNNAWITVDVLTSRVLKNQSEHYQFKINLSNSGTLTTMTTPVIKRSFTQLEGKIFPFGDASYYTLPGKHLLTGGSANVFASDDDAFTMPFQVIKNDSQIGDISEVAADGTRILTAGGSIYVYRT